MIAYQLNFALKSKNIMLMEVVAYLLIAFQLPLALCRPQGLNFNGSNPYYDSYLQNQYWGNNNDNLNSYPTTQKSLYPTLYPQNPNTTPQPYYAKGQYPPNPNSNYFNRNSSFQNPGNNYGTNNFSSFGWNTNFNQQTTPPSTYQPYGQFSTTTVKPPVTTLPPFYPKGSFNRSNQTNPTYPAPNRTIPTNPSYHHYNINRTNPTYPPYRPQNTLPPYVPSPNNFSNFHPQPSFPNNPNYPVSNRTTPTYPTYPSYNHFNSNRTNPTYPPYRPQNTLPPRIPSPNNFPNFHPQPSFPNNPTYPVSNRTTPTYPMYPSYNHYNSNRTNPTKTNNFHNISPINQNSNRNDTKYNPQYRPSAPSFTAVEPTKDHNGTPLATFATFHANQPIDDYLFNYDNLHRRRPTSDMQSGQFQQSNHVPLAPFPGEKPPTYDSVSNVPLAPFPG
ncbi:hypothetical protein HA402_007886 [Bradysia odoriphaga]|nr:hypothetical protein HA402_007886 [Bradysia odoriphaga]